jgi:hypothetical protein
MELKPQRGFRVDRSPQWMVLHQMHHLLKMGTVWQDPDSYAAVILFLHSAVFYTEGSTFMLPKVVTARSDIFAASVSCVW